MPFLIKTLPLQLLGEHEVILAQAQLLLAPETFVSFRILWSPGPVSWILQLQTVGKLLLSTFK